MKQLANLFALSILLALPWSSAAPSPTAQPARGGWTTGSTGALGDVVYGAGTHVIDLATEGVYDPLNWMVVFDYQSLSVEPGATVLFANHPSRAPVVMRALGEIIIAGLFDLNGSQGHHTYQPPSFAEPGPGGFRGGRGSYSNTAHPSAGFGPGGGHLPPVGYQWAGFGAHQEPGSGSPVAPPYGSPACTQLVGGSGAAGGGRTYPQYPNSGGGSGGGAILIGSDSRVSISGTVRANGGNRGWHGGESGNTSFGYGGLGAGGTIRIAAPEIDVDSSGELWAAGTSSAVGYIRLEVDTDTQGDGDPNPNSSGMTGPPPSISATLGEFILQDPPQVRVSSWWDPTAGTMGEWIPVPADPSAAFEPPTWADVQLASPGQTTFRIEGTNVPLGSMLHVRVGHVRGEASFDSDYTMGEVAGSTPAQSWTDVTLDLTEGVTAIQVRVELP